MKKGDMKKGDMKKGKRTSAQMRLLIQQWQRQGVSKKAFCATHNIHIHTFNYWVDKLSVGTQGCEETTSASSGGKGFVRLESIAPDTCMDVGSSVELFFPQGALLRLSGRMSVGELAVVKSLLY
jgi:transposase-like protein